MAFNECPLCKSIMNTGSDDWAECVNGDCGYQMPIREDEDTK